MAAVAVTGGSALADCLGTFRLNSGISCQFSPYTVAVPTTLQDLTGRCLSFREQIGVYLDREERDEAFPESEFVARNAAADEVLAAVQEALALKEEYRPLSPLQERFRQLHPEGLLHFSHARTCEVFLQRHQHPR
jgi:hypothetical protein